MAKPVGAIRRLSRRTPLRTKLITALLGLVIMALAAISIASVYMLRGYIVTQSDGGLKGALTDIYDNGARFPIDDYAAPVRPGSQYIIAIQLPGKQLTWSTAADSTNFAGPGYSQPLPVLPTGTNWAGRPTRPAPLRLPLPRSRDRTAGGSSPSRSPSPAPTRLPPWSSWCSSATSPR